MRYCQKTKLIIRTTYSDHTVEEICNLIKNAGLTERSIKSITKQVNKIKADDKRKEKNRLKFKKRALANPLKYRARTLLSGAKQRVKKREQLYNIEIPFDLDLEWILERLEKGKCEVTSINFYIKPYSSREDYKKVHPHSPSLDQIKPSAGYTKDNVQVVCDQYNKFKGDRHEVDTVRMARSLIAAYEKRHTPSIKMV